MNDEKKNPLVIIKPDPDDFQQILSSLVVEPPVHVIEPSHTDDAREQMAIARLANGTQLEKQALVVVQGDNPDAIRELMRSYMITFEDLHRMTTGIPYGPAMRQMDLERHAHLLHDGGPIAEA